QYPLITKKRMFYETMEELLPTLKVIITDGDTETMYPLDSFVNISNGSGSSSSQNNGSGED
ncbi:MAG TPA: FtsH protease activity modulator HflK, partial [Lachnospiraceae bacterium]|nr:FtsH protease activity modulator HflK [Lachnospiraceae bacterium]